MFEANSAVPLWGAPQRRRPALPGDRDADVVIVGAGYTGLWTAYYLLSADPSLRVVILEKECVGFGASGRNGGWCSAIFPISLDHVAKASSHRSAVQLQRAMNATVNEVTRVARNEDIDWTSRTRGSWPWHGRPPSWRGSTGRERPPPASGWLTSGPCWVARRRPSWSTRRTCWGHLHRALRGGAPRQAGARARGSG
jgi:hypothetical protein